MKYTALSAAFLTRPGGLLTLAALSVSILVLTAACGTRPAPQTSSTAAKPALASSLPVSSAVDVREVNRALTDSEMQDYTGDASCTSCHKQAAAAHAHSSHAHTFRPVNSAHDAPFFRATKVVTDTHIHYAYHTGVEGGKCLMIGKNKQGKEGRIDATYALGTGRTGITYLGEDKEGQWLEMRLSYFPKAHTWDFTPGQPEGRELGRAAGHPLSPGDFQQCLGCHGTAIRATPEGADVARSLMNVGCERCHGPGREHIMQAAKALAVTASLKPAKITDAKVIKTTDTKSSAKSATSAKATYGMEDLHLATPQRITAICGACHRVESAQQPLSPAEEPKLARFQGVALSRSACYQKSGALSCLTCHDAHSNANPSLSRNDAICLRCHTTAAGDHSNVQTASQMAASAVQRVPGKICPINTHRGCTTCHMPKASGIMPYSLFTNHWIKVWPSGSQQSSKFSPDQRKKF